jgi:hypothetical protein
VAPILQRRGLLDNATHMSGVPGRGRSLKDIQELAGHSSLGTTQRYIEADAGAQRKIVDLTSSRNGTPTVLQRRRLAERLTTTSPTNNHSKGSESGGAKCGGQGARGPAEHAPDAELDERDTAPPQAGPPSQCRLSGATPACLPFVNYAWR